MPGIRPAAVAAAMLVIVGDPVKPYQLTALFACESAQPSRPGTMSPGTSFARLTNGSHGSSSPSPSGKRTSPGGGGVTGEYRLLATRAPWDMSSIICAGL